MIQALYPSGWRRESHPVRPPFNEATISCQVFANNYCDYMNFHLNFENEFFKKEKV